jgi:DNA-binding response OmpR family regulator
MKILIIDDNQDHCELMHTALLNHNPAWSTVAVLSGHEALQSMGEKPQISLIVLDFSLPGEDGIEILNQIIQLENPPPVVMVTGRGDEEIAVEVMKAGAYDYLVKGNDYLSRLPLIAQRAVEAHQLKIERQAAVNELAISLALNQAIIEKSPIGVSVRSKTGQLLLANDAWEKIWAIPEDNFEIDHTRERSELTFDDRDSYLSSHQHEVRRIYEEGGDLTLSELKTSPQRAGAADWVSQHFYALYDAYGQVDRVVILTVDITQQKKAEATLKQWNQKLEDEVERRTHDLQIMVDAMVGREVRMADLKKVIKKLRAQLIDAEMEPIADDPLGADF